jgi:hypothetical protein
LKKYINDFPKIILKLSHTILFADDTSIVVTSTNCIELNQKLNCKLHNIFCFEISHLVFKTNKAYLVEFTSSEALIYPLNITHVDQVVAIAVTIKFLGLHLESRVSWTSLINILLKKLNSVHFMMRSLSYILNIYTLRRFSFAQFQALIN